MGTKNFWVLCVSMCLGMFGVYSCEDGDELENERRNSPQEENVEDGSDTMAVVPADTLPSENVRYELEDMLIGEWGWCHEGGYRTPYETFKYVFNANHTGTLSYYFYMNNGGSHSRGEYQESNVSVDVVFSWKVLSENVFTIQSVRAKTRGHGSDGTKSYWGSVKFQLDKVSSDTLLFREYGTFYATYGDIYFDAWDGESDALYSFLLHGKR